MRVLTPLSSATTMSHTPHTVPKLSNDITNIKLLFSGHSVLYIITHINKKSRILLTISAVVNNKTNRITIRVSATSDTFESDNIKMGWHSSLTINFQGVS